MACCGFTDAPTPAPTDQPTPAPTDQPTPAPTENPTNSPTPAPTENPTKDPTRDPTSDPTVDPTGDPTTDPTNDPTSDPTTDPTDDPTTDPTFDPTEDPTTDPTSDPTFEPTFEPTSDPTAEPTLEPTAEPSPRPTPISQSPTEVTTSPTKSPTRVGQVQEPTRRSNETAAANTTIFLRADLTPLWIIIGVTLGICFLCCIGLLIGGMVWYNKKQIRGVNEVNDMLEVGAQSPVSVVDGDGGIDFTFAKQLAMQEGKDVTGITGSTGTMSPIPGEGGGVTRTGSVEYSEDSNDYGVGRTTIGSPGDGGGTNENVLPHSPENYDLNLPEQISLPPEVYAVQMGVFNGGMVNNGYNNYNVDQKDNGGLKDLPESDNEEDDGDENDMYQIGSNIGDNIGVPGSEYDIGSVANVSEMGVTPQGGDDEYEYYYEDEDGNVYGYDENVTQGDVGQDEEEDAQEEYEMNEMYNRQRSTKKGGNRSVKGFE